MNTDTNHMSVSLTLGLDEESGWTVGRFRCFGLLNLPCYIFLDDQDQVVEWIFPGSSFEESSEKVSVFEKGPMEEGEYLVLYYGRGYYYFDPNSSGCEALSWQDETGIKIYSFTPETGNRGASTAYGYGLGGKKYVEDSMIRFRPNYGSKGAYFFDLDSRKIVGFLYGDEMVYRFDKGRRLSDSLALLRHNHRIWAVYNLQTRKAVMFETGKENQTFTRIRHIKLGFRVVPDPLGYEGSGRPILLEIRHNLVWGLYDAEIGKLVTMLEWTDERQGYSRKKQ